MASQPEGYRFPVGRILAIYFALMLVVFLSALDQAIVATAGAAIVADIGGISGYAWLFTAYILAATVTIPLYGKLGDLLGKKRPLVIAVSLFLVGSLLCGLATSFPELVGFRALQGAGAGGLTPLAHATIGSIVPIRERGRYLGLIVGAFALGSVGGPLAGGLLVDTLGWRWVFLVNLPIGVLALALIYRTMATPAETRSARSIDWVGALLLAGCATLFLVVLSSGGQVYSWTSLVILGSVAVAVVLAGLFIAVERRVPEPILPFSLLRRGTVAASVLCIAASGASMFMVIAALPLYAQGVVGLSATAAGVTLIPMLLGMAVAAFLSGQVMVRLGRTRPTAAIGSVLAVVGLILLARLSDHPSTFESGRASALVGLGLGSANQVYLVSVQNAVTRRTIGAATALTHFGRAIGGTLGLAVVGVIIGHAMPAGTNLGGHGLGSGLLAGPLRGELANALRLGFWVAAGLEAAAFLVVVFVLEEVSWQPPGEPMLGVG